MVPKLSEPTFIPWTTWVVPEIQDDDHGDSSSDESNDQYSDHT